MAPKAPLKLETESPDVDLISDPVMGRLKSLYDEVSAEPLPDDLLRLLQKLDQAERAR